MAVGDVWRFTVIGTLREQVVQNVFHAKMTSVVAEAATFAGGLQTLYTALAALSSSDINYNAVECRQLAYPQPQEEDVAWNIDGAVEVDSVPNQIAVVTTLRTGYIGRSYRGRHYLAGLASNQQDDSLVGAGTLTALQTAWNTYVGIWGVAGTNPDWEVGVWSRVLGQSPPPPQKPVSFNYAAGFHSLSSTLVRNILYTQRRRTLGVGY